MSDLKTEFNCYKHGWPGTGMCPDCIELRDRALENAARDAGYIQLSDGTIIHSNPDEEGFWEDWKSCCDSNNITYD